VQVEFFLRHPASAAQVAQPGLGQAVALPGGFVATFQIEVDQRRAAQGFVERGGFVMQVLARNRRGQRGS
jgi:hypothetical protein